MRGTRVDTRPDCVGPLPDATFPPTLTAAKWLQDFQGQQRELPFLRRLAPELLVTMYPDTGSALGFAYGD